MEAIENGLCPHCQNEIDIIDPFWELPIHEESIDYTCTECWENFTATAKVKVSFICERNTNDPSNNEYRIS